MMDTTPASIGVDSRRPHVLVCDDAPALRGLYQDLFEDAGYRVTALPGPPAVEQLRTLRPDAVVLDLLFAGAAEDGWTFLREVRHDPELAATPVVLCTAAFDGRDRENVLATAVQGLRARVAPKPFDIDDLLAQLAEAMASPPAADDPAAGGCVAGGEPKA